MIATTALITGATSGIGKALAQKLASQGVRLILVGRHIKRCQDWAPVSSVLHECDLEHPRQRAELHTLIQSHVPDLVINSAGWGLYGPVLSHTMEDSQGLVEVNIKALMEISIAAATALKERDQRGIILNISSVAALFPYPMFCIYAATKSFVNQFSQALDTEMKPYGIRVLTACPGPVDTGFRGRASQGISPQPNRFEIPIDRVVASLLSQIKKKKTIQYIDARYHVIARFVQLLPRFLRDRALIRSLRGRYRVTKETKKGRE